MIAIEDQSKAVSQPQSRQSSPSGFFRTYGLQIGIFCVLLVIWGLFVIGAPETIVEALGFILLARPLVKG